MFSIASSCNTRGVQRAGRMRPIILRNASHSHVSKLFIRHKNVTIIDAVKYTTYCDFYTCGPAKLSTVMALVFCQTTLGTPVLIFLQCL